MSWKHTFRHVDSSEPLKHYAEDRFQRLSKHLLKDSQWHVTYAMNKIEFEIEVLVRNPDSHFKATAKAPNLYAAVELVAEKLDRQFLKRKDRLQHHKKPSLSKESRLNQVNPRLEFEGGLRLNKKSA